MIPTLLTFADHGANVNTLSNDGVTPLYERIKSGDFDKTKALIENHGADPRFPGSMGAIAIHYAAGSTTQQDKLIPYLLKKGLDPNSTTSNGTTPLHVAAEQGNVVAGKELAKAPNILLSKTNDGQTALHLAAMNGSVDFVTLLLDGLHGELDDVDDFGQTPLWLALAEKHVDVANLLLNRGADHKFSNNDGISSFWGAIGTGDKDIVTRLLDLGSENTSPTGILTPLQVAVQLGNADLVDLLLERGLVDSKSSFPGLPGVWSIHTAAGNGYLDIVKLFHDRYPDMVQYVDDDGNDVLVYAASGGKSDMIEYLVDIGVPLNGLGKSLYTPLQCAAGYFNTVERLLKMGADPNGKSKPPISYTALHGSSMNLRVTELLVEAGASPFERDAFYNTPLDYAPPQVKERLSLMGLSQPAPDSSEANKTIRATIVRCASTLLQAWHGNDGSESIAGEKLSQAVYIYLEALAEGLLRLGTKESIEQAKTCYVALRSFNERRHDNWSCKICFQIPPVTENHYRCRKCPDYEICEACFKGFIVGGNDSKKLLEGLHILEMLESSIYGARLVVDSYMEMIGPLLASTLRALKDDFAWSWAGRILKEYEEWDKQYNKPPRYHPDKLIGLRFVRTLDKAIKFTFDGLNTVEEAIEATSLIKKEMETISKEQKADKDLQFFSCKGHKYLDIPAEADLLSTQKDQIDESGFLEASYLQYLTDQYSSNETSSQTSSKAVSLSDDSLQEQGVTPENTALKSHVDYEHRIESDEQCIIRLTRDFPAIITVRSILINVLKQTYERCPVLKVLMDPNPPESSELEKLDIEDLMLNAREHVGSALILEFAWQILQITAIGFVSRTLTEHLMNQQNELPENTAVSITTSQLRTNYTEETLHSPKTSAENTTAEDDLLKNLPDNIRNEIETFVTRTVEKNKLSLLVQNKTRTEKDQLSMSERTRNKFQSWVHESPFKVYNFYGGSLFPKLIHRNRIRRGS
jgi:ankyrin repeat protein